MSRTRKTTVPHTLPLCYAITFPGLESLAAEEIASLLDAEVRRTAPGLVVFRAADINRRILQLRTTEDVFLLAWGTDELTYRAADLDLIRRWTARDANWDALLRIHHSIRPKPRNKPTFRLVTQMQGKHGYRRIDARKALADGLAGKLPASWRHAEENAAVEIWLTIQGNTAVCGLRLSDRSMRHREYKAEHRPASLRPTLAGSMALLADLAPGLRIVDPTCGAGTILAEVCDWYGRRRVPYALLLGGDLDRDAVRAAMSNVRSLGHVHMLLWNSCRLPLADATIDRILSNPPFGKQLGRAEEIDALYLALTREWHRVLKFGGLAVVLVSDWQALREAARAAGFKQKRCLRVRLLGQMAFISCWQK